MTEHEIRARVNAIVASPLEGARKARQLLGISRALKAQRRSLSLQRSMNRSLWDRNTASHLDRLLASISLLHEDVRAAAFAAMRSSRVWSR